MMIVEFRKSQLEYATLNINGSSVDMIKFLGVQMSDNLIWSQNTSGICSRRKLKQAALPRSVLTSFYRGVVVSVITYCISTWFSSCRAAYKKALQRVVRGAERVALFPSRGKSIVWDPLRPLHKLFEQLPLGKSFRSIRSRTSRLQNSFPPQAMRRLNSHFSILPPCILLCISFCLRYSCMPLITNVSIKFDLIISWFNLISAWAMWATQGKKSNVLR